VTTEDQQQKLRELIARGQNVTAIDTARKLYGCSLGEAKQKVDSLRENKVPQ
jgi:ribosomal protein L7/L12